MAFIGNVSEDIRVCYTRTALGRAQLERPPRPRSGRFRRDRRCGTSGNIDTAMLRNLFGVKLKQVQGYAGSADKRLALEKGEI